MKKFALFTSITFASASLLLLCGAASSTAPILKADTTIGPVLGSKLPTEIDLSDSTEVEIRSYYGPIATLSFSERTGTNLLKNLRPILQDLTYFKYDDVWKIYEITDREWSLSPAASDADNQIVFDGESKFTSYKYGTSNTNGGSNPYVHTLYRNRDENGVTVADAQIREWGDHNATGTNREHVWCQSRGFKAESGAEGPAGTDLHHLISGDGKVNQSYHNNSPYGYVDKTKTYKNAGDYQPWLDGNLVGPQLHEHEGDQVTSVFEPQDSDKGDIARACFYMAACYNNWSGQENITQFNPNLVLANYATDAGAAEDSSASHPVAMGILSDLLEWNKLDPVDEYEIHRNNLIFKNFQRNRNPFIDFPEWADIIWGSNSGKIPASPDKDKINTSSALKKLYLSATAMSLKEGQSQNVTAVTSQDATVEWSIEDPTVAEISANGNTCTVKAITSDSTKKTVVKAKAVIDGEEYVVSCNVSIKAESSGNTGDDEPDDSMSKMISSFLLYLSGLTILPIVLIAIFVVVIVVIIIVIVASTAKNKRKKKKALNTVKKEITSSLKKNASKTKKKK